MTINLYTKVLGKGLRKSQFLRYVLLLFLLTINYQTAHSQPCDPKITPIDNWEIRYRERGKRCEGFYRSRVEAGTIDVVGLIKGSFHFTLDKDEVIEVSCPIVKNKLIHVRAVGIPIKTYYRMDAQIEPGEKLTWPIKDVIYTQRLSEREIGIFGWIGETEKIYVPVVATTDIDFVADDEEIKLYLRASVDVEPVKWRYSDVVDDNCSMFGEWKDTPKTSYQIGQPILITLPLSRTGELCVEVAARDQKTARWLKRNIRVIVEETKENGEKDH